MYDIRIQSFLSNANVNSRNYIYLHACFNYTLMIQFLFTVFIFILYDFYVSIYYTYLCISYKFDRFIFFGDIRYLLSRDRSSFMYGGGGGGKKKGGGGSRLLQIG